MPRLGGSTSSLPVPVPYSNFTQEESDVDPVFIQDEGGPSPSGSFTQVSGAAPGVSFARIARMGFAATGPALGENLGFWGSCPTSMPPLPSLPGSTTGGGGTTGGSTSGVWGQSSPGTSGGVWGAWGSPTTGPSLPSGSTSIAGSSPATKQGSWVTASTGPGAVTGDRGIDNAGGGGGGGAGGGKKKGKQKMLLLSTSQRRY